VSASRVSALESERICDEVTIMSHGEAVVVGPPRQLIAKHTRTEALCC
jgi:ABC-type multidrug transport system ATPase subunit